MTRAWIPDAFAIFCALVGAQARADAPITITQPLDFGPVTLSTKTSPNLQPTALVPFEKFHTGQLTQVQWTRAVNRLRAAARSDRVAPR